MRIAVLLLPRTLVTLTASSRSKYLQPSLTDRDIANVRYELGQMHLNGTGARPDKLEAYFWFRLAEVAGHPTAIQAQQALASQMTNEQIATAAEKASRWLSGASSQNSYQQPATGS